ncbi:MAG TPA: helix-turn-helix transcriptional regulator [Pirellulales bacterium]|nr:helix-turn-helix transcriptional regulator [Pirellulales bacterium]
MPTVPHRRRNGTWYIYSSYDGRKVEKEFPDCGSKSEFYTALAVELKLPSAARPKVVAEALLNTTWTGTEWLDDPPPRPTLARQIRTAREAAGLTKSEAASVAGLEWKRWHEYETGEVEPTANKLATIARSLRVSADQLLGLV